MHHIACSHISHLPLHDTYHYTVCSGVRLPDVGGATRPAHGPLGCGRVAGRGACVLGCRRDTGRPLCSGWAQYAESAASGVGCLLGRALLVSPYHTLGGGAPHSGVAAVPHRAQTRGRGTGSRLGQRCGLCGRPIPGGSDDAALSGSASSVARYDAAADRWEPLVSVTKDRVLALAARNLCSPLAAARAWRSYFCRCCSGTGGDEEPDQPL